MVGILQQFLSDLTNLLAQVLKAMGKEFLDGYASLAEGEKDPRNLIIAFAIARVILIEFDIHERVEVRDFIRTDFLMHSSTPQRLSRRFSM